MDQHMNVFPTSISGLMVVETAPHIDTRGAFARLYCQHELVDLIGVRKIVQVNYSRTVTLGAVRGLHFQYPPYAEMKLVRCLKGRVWDIAVDLRRHSSTFLSWHAEVLTPTNARMMVIPEGFAHGFQALEAESELLYMHTAFYMPDAEGGLCHDDMRLGITWPLAVTDVSKRDASHAYLKSDFHGIAL
jgi:dTDP-4-dehydrorhamnose 3,5-epimerase